MLCYAEIQELYLYYINDKCVLIYCHETIQAHLEYKYC